MAETGTTQAGITLDRQLVSWLASYAGSGGRIWCQRGCSNCCNLMVNTSLREAAQIAASLDSGQLQALDSYMQALKSALTTVSDFKSFLKVHRQVIGLCPFLNSEQSCGIYPVRPLACRALLSTRPPAWCAVNFSSLHELERDAFLSSLDRAVVAFPSHYAAAPQRWAAQLEQQLLESQRQACGFAVGGHLPSLVWLEHHYDLSGQLERGVDAIKAIAGEQGLAAPYLFQFS